MDWFQCNTIIILSLQSSILEALVRMSFSSKMLPCKKRRAIQVEPSKGESGPSSGAQSVPAEPSSSSGIQQLQGSMQQDEEANLTERRAQPSPSADGPACLSAPVLPGPVGDVSVSEAPGGEVAKGVEVSSRNAAQKVCTESAEALVTGAKKIFPKPGADACQQKNEAGQDSKAAPDFVMEEERKPDHEGK